MTTPSDLKLSPLSERIQTGAKRLQGGITRLAHIGVPRIKLLEPPADRPLIHTQINPEPDYMCPKQGEARSLERPPQLEGHLEAVTSQFFLRNTGRVERFVDTEHLEWEWAILRSTDWQVVRGCGERDNGIREAMTPRGVIHEHIAQRRSLVVESRWSDQFGRPDPEPGESA